MTSSPAWIFLQRSARDWTMLREAQSSANSSCFIVASWSATGTHPFGRPCDYVQAVVRWLDVHALQTRKVRKSHLKADSTNGKAQMFQQQDFVWLFFLQLAEDKISVHLFIKIVWKTTQRHKDSSGWTSYERGMCIHPGVHRARVMGLFIGHLASQLCWGFSERMREPSCPLLAIESAVGGGGGVRVSVRWCPEQSSRAARVGQSKDQGLMQRTSTHHFHMLPYVCFAHFNLVEWLTRNPGSAADSHVQKLSQTYFWMSHSELHWFPLSVRAQLYMTEDNSKKFK